MKFKVSIGDANAEIDGGFATEDTLAKLLKAYEKINGNTTVETKNTNKALKGLGGSADGASASVNVFSDTLDEADSFAKRAAKKLETMGNKATDAASSLYQFGESGASISDMLAKAGGIAGDALAGVGTFVSDGLGRLLKTVSTVVVGLAALAVRMIESYVQINKDIINSGIMFSKGFEDVSALVGQADVPLNEFMSAVIANTDSLRLMSGGQASGMRSVAAAFEVFEDGALANLYSMGFTTEEVVASMVNYSLQADQAGKMLTPKQLGVETAKYMKNLRELSILTGTSVKEAQAQIVANRANLFIQNSLAGLAPEVRSAVESAIASLPKAYSAAADYVATGQSVTEEGNLLVNSLSTTMGIYRQGIEKIKDGTLAGADFESWTAAQQRLKSDAIKSEIINAQRTFGAAAASAYGSMGAFNEMLGIATNQAATGLMAAEQLLTEGVEGNATGMGAVLGNFEQTVNELQSLIQETFMKRLIDLAPAINTFINGVNKTGGALDTLRDEFEKLLGGDYTSIIEMLDKISDAIGDGLVKGFDRVMAMINPLAEYSSYDTPSAVGLKTVELGLDTVDFLVNSIDTGLNLANPFWWSGYTKGLPTDIDSGTDFQEWATQPPKATPTPEPSDPTIPPDSARNSADRGNQVPTPPAEILPAMSSGGRVRAPMSGGLALLHDTEAVVPLPDGRSIPVDMSSFRTALESALAPDSDPAEVASVMDEIANSFSLDSSKIIDGSRTMPELLQVNKALLAQNFALNEKFDRMVKAMESGNNINRSSAFARA